MKRCSKISLRASDIRRFLLELLAGLGVAALMASSAGAQTRPSTPPFTLASLEGAYAYTNSLSNVASYGVFRFDGRGGLSVNALRVNRECASCQDKRSIYELADGKGSYQINADGTGSFTVGFTTINPNTQRPYTYTYELLVTNAVELADGKRLAIQLFAPGTAGGVDGQLFAPTLTRQTEIGRAHV